MFLSAKYIDYGRHRVSSLCQLRPRKHNIALSFMQPRSNFERRVSNRQCRELMISTHLRNLLSMGGEDRNHDCWYYKIRGEYPRLQPRDESDNSSATTADGWMGYSTVLKHQALILNNYKLLYRRSECWKSTEPIKRRSATTHR